MAVCGGNPKKVKEWVLEADTKEEFVDRLWTGFIKVLLLKPIFLKMGYRRGGGWVNFLYSKVSIKNDGNNKDNQVQAHRIDQTKTQSS
jgi:hypothetical protein